MDGRRFTSSVERCSEGIVGVGCLVVWNGRADSSPVGWVYYDEG